MNTTGVRFYPNKITIMNRTDYNCDVTNDNTISITTDSIAEQAGLSDGDE